MKNCATYIIGGTNQLFTPAQSTLKASTPFAAGHQNLEWNLAHLAESGEANLSTVKGRKRHEMYPNNLRRHSSRQNQWRYSTNQRTHWETSSAACFVNRTEDAKIHWRCPRICDFLEQIISMLSNPATPKEIQSRFYVLVFKDSLLILSKGLALTMTRPGNTWTLFMEIHTSCQTQ